MANVKNNTTASVVCANNQKSNTVKAANGATVDAKTIKSAFAALKVERTTERDIVRTICALQGDSGKLLQDMLGLTPESNAKQRDVAVEKIRKYYTFIAELRVDDNNVKYTPVYISPAGIVRDNNDIMHNIESAFINMLNPKFVQKTLDRKKRYTKTGIELSEAQKSEKDKKLQTKKDKHEKQVMLDFLANLKASTVEEKNAVDVLTAMINERFKHLDK